MTGVRSPNGALGGARYLVLAFATVLPWALKRRVLERVLGYRIHPTARIGLSLVNCREVELGPNVYIGHLCVIQGLDRLRIGEGGHVGPMNWIKAPRPDHHWFVGRPERDPSCYLGDHAILTARHSIDCSDAVTIGDFSMLAGGGTWLLTHEIDLDDPLPRCAPIRIGDRCLLHGRVTVRAGSTLPEGAVIAAGGVVVSPLSEGYTLYGGVPVQPLKKVDPGAEFFNRRPGGA
jgi:acetyltransferase-like isoleucine patch superfamily enzyme